MEAHDLQDLSSKLSSLAPLLISAGEKQLVLELKPYLQPFERVLALAELRHFIPKDPNIQFFGDEAQEYIVTETTVPENTLIQRLAYWQRVGNPTLKPTMQTLYEFTQRPTSDSHGTPEMHRSRRLRYGPHDLHQYRGKFFPQLVRALINYAGLDKDSVVLDPMCGSGTAACEANSLGMDAVGCDLNPLSVLISRVKAQILDVSPMQLELQARTLLTALSPDPSASLEERWTPIDLEYLLRWFAPEALSELSHMLDQIETVEHAAYRDFLKVCLSDVIRGVSWQKDADLRVRKQARPYLTGQAVSAFRDQVERQLERLIPYLHLVQNGQCKAIIREGDSATVHALFPEYLSKCDVLITSPPYAMALPYLDTDRLSLVVMGMLSRKEIRQRESSMIGNREITEKGRQALWATYQRRKMELTEEIRSLVDGLADVNHGGGVGFRRRNLPALLSKYFLDMKDAMRNARTLMKPESYAFYIVGSNSTTVDGKRMEIETGRLLWELGKREGWTQEAMLEMELLPSRDIFKENRGAAEHILVFKNNLSRTAIYSGGDLASQYRLKGEEWNFHGDETDLHLHSLHPYPAKFIPQIPRKAVLTWTQEGDTVLDPFCGCGTTLLECSLLNRNSLGVDNNAVAVLTSRAKISNYSQEDLRVLREFGPRVSTTPMRSGVDLWIPEYKNRDYWFDRECMRELSVIKQEIEEVEGPATLLLLSILSSIIVRVSYQDSDTRYTRIARPYDTGETTRAFLRKLRDTVPRLEEIIHKTRAESDVYLGDSRNLSFVADNTIDLVVTSPPYLNAYDYHKYHRHRLHWIGGDVEMARDTEIGKHDTFTRRGATPDRYFDDMKACFAEWQRVLRHGGSAFIVIGDAIVNGQPVKVGDRFVSDLETSGLHLLDRWIRRLPDTKRSFNIRNSRINEEHLLLFEKR